MTMANVVRRAARGLCGLMLMCAGCGWAYNHSEVLVLTKVNVPANGGAAEVMFHAISGQRVEISLTGRLTSMVPIGRLVGPSGSQVGTLDSSGVSDGFNTAQVDIPATGMYRLEVFDESAAGGAVTVRVELVSGG